MLETCRSKNHATQVGCIISLEILLGKTTTDFMFYSNSSKNMLINYNSVVIIITLSLCYFYTGRTQEQQKLIPVLIYINNQLHFSDCASKLYLEVTLDRTWIKNIMSGS